jgi:methyl-accepting chemotaxis protein
LCGINVSTQLRRRDGFPRRILVQALPQTLKAGAAPLAGAAAGTVLAYLFHAGPVWSALIGALATGAACLSWRARSGKAEGGAIAKVAHAIDDIMIGAAETSYFVESVQKKVELDVRTSGTVRASAEQNAASTGSIAALAGQAATVAGQVRSESATGRREIDAGLERIGQARSQAQQAARTMEGLQANSRSIAGFTETIAEISARTNLLALNAAIEAARAGEHGRGFAVVAGEVRQLAQRTKEATDQIGAIAKSIIEQAEHASQDMSTLSGAVLEASGNVETVHQLLSSIEQSATESEREIERIAQAAKTQVASTAEILDALVGIEEHMLATDKELPRVAASAMALVEKAEAIVEALSESQVATQHDVVRLAAQQAAEQVGRVFAEAVRAGRISENDLFDRNYVPIPDTDPQKFHTRFDRFTDQVLPEIQESLLARLPQLSYAGAVDTGGYFPTHNKKFSQPLTGDYATDIVNNRTKRIFTDRTGSRCGAHQKAMLLQTYKRDTGEVMHDLSVPIYVNGRHWGGFRIGYRSHSQQGAAVLAYPGRVAAPRPNPASAPQRLRKTGS